MNPAKSIVSNQFQTWCSELRYPTVVDLCTAGSLEKDISM